MLCGGRESNVEIKEGLLALGISFSKAFDYSELSIGRLMIKC